MTLRTSKDTVPLSEYRIEASADEPDEVRAQVEIIADQVRRGIRGRPGTATLEAVRRSARGRADREGGVPTENMRKAMFALAHDLQLTRQDRIDLAEMTLDRDVESWRELSFDEASKILTAMNGYTAIRWLRTRK